MDEEPNDKDKGLNIHAHKKGSDEESKTSDLQRTESPKTFEPQPIGPDFTPVRTKKRKVKKWMIIVPVLIVLVVAAGAGAFYLINNQKPASEKAKTPASSKSTSDKQVSSLQPTDVVTKVQDYVKTIYPQVMPEGTKLTAEQIYFKDSSSAPNWKLSGEKFYISYSDNGSAKTDIYYNWESGGNDAGSARYIAISNAVVKSLVDQGFVKNTDSVYITDSGNQAYTKDDAVCVVSSPDNGAISPPASLACGQISKYTKNLDNYKEIEPYATAYEKAGKIQVGDIFSFSELKSGLNSYKNAKIGLGNAGAMVGGAMGLFYKSPSGDWQFFTGTQQIIECSAYSTKDLQYAFAYESCYDDSKTGDDANSLVASYYKLQ